MSNAPPTPPPTGATELMDQEKEVAVTAHVEAPAATETAPSTSGSASVDSASAGPYRSVLRTISDLLSLHNVSAYPEIIRVAELADLNREGDDRPSRLAVTAPLVLAYLIQDELPPARFAFTRLPQAVASQPLARCLFSLYTAVSERIYENVYANIEKVVRATADGGLDPDLGAVLSVMVSTFVETFRQRMLALISRAYTSIGLPVAQTYFGLGSEHTVGALKAAGWAYDESSQVLTATTSTRIKISRVHNGPSSLNNLDLLATTSAKAEA